MPENHSSEMREKAQGVHVFTIILVNAELNNFYSGKCLSYPLDILGEDILNVRNGFIIFLLNLLKLRF